MKRISLILTILIISFNSFAECDYQSLLKKVAINGNAIFKVADLDIYKMFQLSQDPSQIACTCKIYDHFTEKTKTPPEYVSDTFWKALSNNCMSSILSDPGLSSCETEDNPFLALYATPKDLPSQLDHYNIYNFNRYKHATLSFKLNNTGACVRDSNSLLAIVLHHTSHMYFSKSNLDKPEYYKNMEDIFGKQKAKHIKTKESNTHIMDSFDTDDSISYVKVLHNEHQNGMHEWSGVGYHYIVSYSKNAKKWQTTQGRSPYLVGVHTGKVKMSTYPRKYIDKEWKKKSLNKFLKINDDNSRPKMICVENNRFVQRPINDSWNDFSIGIVVKGHFIKKDHESTLDPINPSSMKEYFPDGLEDHLKGLVEDLKKSFPKISKVIRHSDIRDTACPGELGGELNNKLIHFNKNSRGLVDKLDEHLRSVQ